MELDKKELKVISDIMEQVNQYGKNKGIYFNSIDEFLTCNQKYYKDINSYFNVIESTLVMLSTPKDISATTYFRIKDNHIEVSGSITKAVESCFRYKKKHNTKFKIEVETKNLKEVEEALKTKADIIMLDNFEIDKMKQAVQLINGKFKIEASGGVNLETVRAIAETGVDYISVGALTHSVKALDISLEIAI